MADLIHYAANPVNLDHTRRYIQERPCTYRKPVGLWVSTPADDGWQEWCEAEAFDLTRISHQHHVTIHPDANIRWIKHCDELDDFQNIYAVQTDYERTNSDLYHSPRHWPIDWPKVAADYDGIIIVPYQHSRRYESQWYYGWDCASGCIWNLDAIESFQHVEHAEQATT